MFKRCKQFRNGFCGILQCQPIHTRSIITFLRKGIAFPQHSYQGQEFCQTYFTFLLAEAANYTVLRECRIAFCCLVYPQTARVTWGPQETTPFKSPEDDSVCNSAVILCVILRHSQIFYALCSKVLFF